MLNEKFLSMWAKDGYSDYLNSFGSIKKMVKGTGERPVKGAGFGAGGGSHDGSEEGLETGLETALDREENLSFLQELSADLELGELAILGGNSLARRVEMLEDNGVVSHSAAIEQQIAMTMSADHSSSSAAAVAVDGSSAEDHSSATLAASVGVAAVGTVDTDIDDKCDFGDPRITPQLLRQLIAKNQKVGRLLYKTMLAEDVK